MTGSVPVRIVRADAFQWDEVRRLFGRAGAENGCWCQYWLLGPEYHRRDRSRNAEDLEAQVRSDRAGLLALRGDEPVGWARLTPRSELAYLTDRFARFDFPEGDPLSLTCFFIRRDARGAGVMAALIAGAKREARKHGRPVEAYPVDPDAPGATKNRFPGVLPTFLEAGFQEVGRLAPDRVVVRAE
ncbi:GNAT family N-acetyltransferase [Leifsonia sp. 2TAF2]|uniref:GNAT family N-acetyltransferase n=1 Tax=Leifsonia sp. 2TAF2 TaxID=3233009 RepID=UPI003F9DAEF7